MVELLTVLFILAVTLFDTLLISTLLIIGVFTAVDKLKLV